MEKLENDAPFSEWTRKEKRTSTLVYEGKRITVLDYIGRMTAFLNSRYSAKVNNKPVDHYDIMYKKYMEKGITAVEEYLNLYRDATIKQQADLEKWKGEAKPLDVLEATNTLKKIKGGE